MDYLFRSQYNWKEFFLTFLLLATVYVVLFLLHTISQRSSFSGYVQTKMKYFFRQIFTLYELVALILLIGVFVLINPIFHGLITIMLVWSSFSYIKSYISGRWIHLDNVINEGTSLKINNLQGTVSKMVRMKMYLQTNEGLCPVRYDQLYKDGYTLVSGKEIGVFYRLEVSPKETLSHNKNHSLNLLDLLTTAPYIDWKYKPQLSKDAEKPNTVNIRLLVREETHLHDLMALVREWGYHCKLVS